MSKGLESALQSLKKNTPSFGPKANYFRLKDGETATIRFLEEADDIRWAYMYQVPVMGAKYPVFVPTLDQEQDGADCPFRDSEKVTGAPRLRFFANVIWRGAPKYKKDQTGKYLRDSNNQLLVDGNEDAVAIWNNGRRVLEQLYAIDQEIKGITSRDIKVRRQGAGKETQYIIYPSETVVELSDNDKRLANDKFDVTSFVKPPSFDEAMEMLGVEKTTNDAIESAKSANLFLNAQ